MIIGDKLGWLTNSYLLHPHQCYLGNKYLIHAYSSSIQPLVGCILAWNSLFAKVVVLAKVLMKPLYCKCEQLEMSAYFGEYIKPCSWFTNPKYVILAIILHINSSKCSHVQYWWNCILALSFGILSVWYLLTFSLHFNYLFFPCW